MSFASLAAVVASAAMVTSGITAPTSATEGTLSASPKVTSEIRQQLSGESHADFWLRLGDLPDLSRAAKTADWGERGENVVRTLKEAAKSSQADVVAQLDRAGADYEAFWVTNAILVHDGTAALATRLANMTDVKRVTEVTYLTLDDPPDRATDGRHAAAGIPWGVEEVGAPWAWSRGHTGEGITVANLDTGVDADHPALWRSFAGTQADTSISTDYTWFDVVEVCDEARPCDPGHHGSHTMGTMVGDDLAGHPIGVAPGARWIATNPLGEGAASNATMLEAAQWTLAPTRADGSDPDPTRRPHIVNNSWGGSTTDADWFDDMLTAWDAAGIFAVFANGNSGPWCATAGSPGERTAAYSVGAYDESGAIADFSSRGGGQDGPLKPNISAPGVNVLSANGHGGYYYENGTSMASPHVAGAVALLWNAEPRLIGDVARTRELLDATARDVEDTTCGGTAADNNVWGEGKVSVPALIDAAQVDTVVGRLDVTVTGPGGTPIEDARVRIANASLTGTTDQSGHIDLPLRADQRELDVEVSAFSYSSETAHVTVPESGSGTLTVQLEQPDLHTVSGMVTESALGRPAGDATVQLTSAAGVTTTVAADAGGAYVVPGVPAGEYTLRVDLGAPLAPATRILTVAGETVADVVLTNTVDGGRYSAVPGNGPYLQADTPLEVNPTGLTPVELPFDFGFYGGTYRTVYVATTGYLTFTDGPEAFTPTPLPSRNQPNAAIYAQWSSTSLDERSQILTRQTTIDEHDAVVVEWRDVLIREARVSFSATLVADGSVILGWGPQSGRYSIRSGGLSLIGMEDETGAVASQYAHGVPGSAVTGVTLTYSRPETVFVSGTVTDRNDGKPVADATVSAQASDGGHTTKTRTADDGTYRLPVGRGKVTVTAEARRYEPVTSTVHAGASGGQLSPRLPTGLAEIKGGPLEWRLAPNGTATTEVTVRNTGTAPLEIEHLGTMFPGDNASGSPGTDAAVGTVLDEWQVPGAFFPFGVAYDGNVWVNNFLTQQIMVLNRQGELRRTLPYQGWSSGSALALNPTTGNMCQLAGGGRTQIVCFDRQTGEVRRTYEGEWSSWWSGGLSYDSAEDVFYLGSSSTGSITVVAGSTHTEPGAIVRELHPEDTGIVDVAFHGTSDTVWMASGWGYLHQLDPKTGAILRTVNFAPEYYGGIAFDSSGALWVLDQEWSTMYLIDVGEDPAFNDVPWLNIATSTTTIPRGRKATLTLTVRAGPHAGTSTTDVALITDAGRARVKRAPARLEVIEYDLAIDAGGPGFTDAAGVTWEPDQQLRGHTDWGWRPPARTSMTTEAIGETTDDDLFQSARTGGEVNYVFRDLPAGTYEVTAGFAEQRPDPGRSLLDVVVNGETVIRDLDVAADASGPSALVRTMKVQHGGGDLTVDVTGDSPHLAALRVKAGGDQSR